MTEIERRLKAVLEAELSSWTDKELERIAADLAAAVGASETRERFGIRNPRTNEVRNALSHDDAVNALRTRTDLFAGWEVVSCVKISGCTPWEPVQ